jgi:cytochrome c1
MSTMHRAKTGLAALLLSATLVGTGPAIAAETEAEGGGHAAIERQKWSFGGLFGKFDDAQLQRGFRVYMEVCARCHGMSRIHFRNLSEPGGPGFPEAAVKSLAATFQYDDTPNEQGKIGKRPGLLTDPLPLQIDDLREFVECCQLTIGDRVRQDDGVMYLKTHTAEGANRS